jgi:hypothetical protein
MFFFRKKLKFDGTNASAAVKNARAAVLAESAPHALATHAHPMEPMLTPEDKKLLSEAMARGPLTWDVVDEVKAAHGNKYPVDLRSFVSKVQPVVFDLSIHVLDSAPAPRSAAALKIDGMCEAQLTANGLRMASNAGVNSSDVRCNVFIVTVNSVDDSRVDIRGLSSGGFSIGRNVGDVIEAKRRTGGGYNPWVSAE